MMFANRPDAGRQLGEALLVHPPTRPIVIGISRGGVPVAAEVAHMLHAPLDICVVRKLFSPGSPGFGIGAVAEHDAVYLDEAEIAKLDIANRDVERAIALESAEVNRLAELLRDGPPPQLAGRDVIVVDDAVTSIDTLRAAARSMRTQDPCSLVLAVPVGNAALLDRLRSDFDRIVCLDSEPTLVAAGSRYRDFWPVSEAEVAAVLADAQRDDWNTVVPL